MKKKKFNFWKLDRVDYYILIGGIIFIVLLALFLMESCTEQPQHIVAPDTIIKIDTVFMDTLIIEKNYYKM
jgi:hypothetical protein